MTTTEPVFREEAASPRPVSLPLSHLSIEVGHFYSEDYRVDDATLRERFIRTARWLAAVNSVYTAELGDRRPRISTCFMIDDYFGRLPPPNELVPRILAVAAEADLRIDYLARESGCAHADGVDIAGLVESRLVAEPSPGDNGSRPPVRQTGWLSNGQRGPSAKTEAMSLPIPWQPPAETAANRHSVFIDVELWSDAAGERTWSCAYLAAVWQLLRLGVLRFHGKAVAEPARAPQDWGTDWAALPAVVRVNGSAASFWAYRNISILDPRFIQIEHAVRTIVGQVALAPDLIQQLADRIAAEGMSVPAELTDRVQYVFATQL